MLDSDALIAMCLNHLCRASVKRETECDAFRRAARAHLVTLGPIHNLYTCPDEDAYSAFDACSAALDLVPFMRLEPLMRMTLEAQSV